MAVKQVWLITINNILLYLSIGDDVCMCGNPVIMLDIFQTSVTCIRWWKWFMETGRTILQSFKYTAISPASTASNTLLPSLSRTHYTHTHTHTHTHMHTLYAFTHTHQHPHTHTPAHILSLCCVYLFIHIYFSSSLYIYIFLIQFLLEPVQKQITASLPVYADFNW